MFEADETKNQEDLLSRDNYANKLGEKIKRWKDKKTLVIGINGEWGSGKTFLKNQIVNSLNHKNIFEFNPWEWASGEKLSTSFFKELSSYLQSTGKIKLSDLYEKFSSTINKTEYHLSNLLGVAILITAIINLGIYIYGVINPDNSKVANFLLLIFASALPAFFGLREILKKYTKLIKSKYDYFPIEDIKGDLTKEFSKLEEPLIIVLDDIDRLTPNETYSLFQLVKSNLDFPNLVFILLYEREHVCESLEKIGISDSSRYIEKIVHIPLNIPCIEGDNLIEIFNLKVDEISKEYKLEIDTKRIDYRYYDDICNLLNDLRKLRRFTNSLKFHLDLFKDLSSSKGGYDINYTDLVLLELIRVSEPKVYEVLPNYAQELTNPNGLRNLYIPKKEKKEEIREKCKDEILGFSSEKNKKFLENILRLLFPVLFGIANRDDELEKNRRVGSIEFFSRYFTYNINEKTQASEKEFENWLSKLDNYEEFIEFFEDLETHQKKYNLLLKLIRGVNTPEKENDKNLLKFCSELYEKYNDSGYLSSIHITSYRLALNLINEKDSIYNFLKDTLLKTNNYSLLLSITDIRNTAPDKDFSEEEIKKLRQETLNHISKLTDYEWFKKSKHRGRLLYLWQENDKDSCIKFIQDFVEQSDYNLLDFIFSQVQETTSSHWGLYWTLSSEGIKRYIDNLSPIEDRVDSIDYNDIGNYEHKIAYKAFQKAKGKGYSEKALDRLDVVESGYAVLESEI